MPLEPRLGAAGIDGCCATARCCSPAGQRPPRARVDGADVEQGPRGVGRRARRRGHGRRAHRPPAAPPLPHRQHPRQQLPRVVDKPATSARTSSQSSNGTTRRLNGALRHAARADRDLRRNAALHRCRLPGLGLDPRRHHPSAWALRHEEPVRQAEEGHLAVATAQGLAAHPQPVETARTYRDHRTVAVEEAQ